MSHKYTAPDLESGLSINGGHFDPKDPRSQLTVSLNIDSTAQSKSAAEPQAPPPAYLSFSSQDDDKQSQTWDPTATNLATGTTGTLRGGGWDNYSRTTKCGLVTAGVAGLGLVGGGSYLAYAHEHGLPPWHHPHPEDSTGHHHHFSSRGDDGSESGAGSFAQGAIAHHG